MASNILLAHKGPRLTLSEFLSRLPTKSKEHLSGLPAADGRCSEIFYSLLTSEAAKVRFADWRLSNRPEKSLKFVATEGATRFLEFLDYLGLKRRPPSSPEEKEFVRSHTNQRKTAVVVEVGDDWFGVVVKDPLGKTTSEMKNYPVVDNSFQPRRYLAGFADERGEINLSILELQKALLTEDFHRKVLKDQEGLDDADELVEELLKISRILIYDEQLRLDQLSRMSVLPILQKNYIEVISPILYHKNHFQELGNSARVIYPADQNFGLYDFFIRNKTDDYFISVKKGDVAGGGNRAAYSELLRAQKETIKEKELIDVLEDKFYGLKVPVVLSNSVKLLSSKSDLISSFKWFYNKLGLFKNFCSKKSMLEEIPFLTNSYFSEMTKTLSAAPPAAVSLAIKESVLKKNFPPAYFSKEEILGGQLNVAGYLYLRTIIHHLNQSKEGTSHLLRLVHSLAGEQMYVGLDPRRTFLQLKTLKFKDTRRAAYTSKIQILTARTNSLNFDVKA